MIQVFDMIEFITHPDTINDLRVLYYRRNKHRMKVPEKFIVVESEHAQEFVDRNFCFRCIERFREMYYLFGFTNRAVHVCEIEEPADGYTEFHELITKFNDKITEVYPMFNDLKRYANQYKLNRINDYLRK